MKFKKIILITFCIFLLTSCSKNDLAIKVGFIYSNSSDDQGINQMQRVACSNMVDYFNGVVQTISKSSVTPENIEAVIYDMVNSGVSIIFISSNDFDEQVVHAAQAYDNVDFIVYNGTVEAANVKNYFARQYEADYLCGIVAGSSTTSDLIGYLSPDNSSQNLVHINAFALGVYNSNPDATIELYYTGQHATVSKIQGVINRIISNGCDIIASCSPDNTALIEAGNNGVMVIGASPIDIDTSDNYLTAQELNLTDFFIEQVESVLNGTFDNSVYTGTIYDDFVGLDDYTYHVSGKTKQLTDSTLQEIKQGNLAVFTGPFSDTNGNVIAQEGQILSELDLQNMNYLLSNIRVLD